MTPDEFLANALFGGLIAGLTLGFVGWLVAMAYRAAKATIGSAVENKKEIRDFSQSVFDSTHNNTVSFVRSLIRFFNRLFDQDAAIDEKFFGIALREVNGDEKQEGLWAKALTMCKHDEDQAKTLYIRLRARALRDAEK